MTEDDIRKTVIEIVAERFDEDPTKLTDSTSFIEDLNADSLDIAEMSLDFEDRFDISIPENEKGITTIGETVAFVKKAKG